METAGKQSRAEASLDGCLIEVTETARKIGIRVPVDMTAMAWERCIGAPEEADKDVGERLRDVLYDLREALANTTCYHDSLSFRFRTPNKNRFKVPPMITLKAIYGLGDKGRPVLTIKLLNEV